MGFEAGVARLVAAGGLDRAGDGSRVVDTYSVVLADGETRPHTEAVKIGDRTVAANVSGIPAVGDAHPFFGAPYRLKEVEWSQPDPASRVWNAALTYDDSTEDGGGGGGGSDKPDRITAKSWSSRRVLKDVTSDAETGAALVNSVGDAIELRQQADAAYPVVSFTRLENESPASKCQLSGTLNSSSQTVMGVAFPARCGRLTVSAAKSTVEGYRYAVTYTVEMMRNRALVNGTLADIGWDVAVMDCGFRARLSAGSDPVRYQVKGADGSWYDSTTPVPLAADGTVAATPRYIRVATAQAASWASLKLLAD